MPLTSFKQMLDAAERGGYAVGYFESWDLASTLAVADAAEAARSPVILGFSGMYLSHPERAARDRLSHYAAFGLDVCRSLSVPACLLFNECSNLAWVLEAIDLGFQVVMFTDEALSFDEQAATVRQVADAAHARAAAVEGEITPLTGAGGGHVGTAARHPATDVVQALEFLERTQVDALAVDIGQVHTHGRTEARLDLERLANLHASLRVPLVLHGATSVAPADLAEAPRRGIRKINVGSALKQVYFDALRQACARAPRDYNPYEVIGSGLATDVLTVARVTLQRKVEGLIELFGSAGKAS
ncbi:MAG TPA: hypothetical protein HPP83_00615 [Candidatus Hydrogenedentes bacterium]|nr:hypothetical protein [Candidatus Hydrogenedentota bacterium]